MGAVPLRLNPPVSSIPTTKKATQLASTFERIQASDPTIAGVLYRTYAPEVREYLRRHSSVEDVEDSVIAVLLIGVRSARSLEIQSVESFKGILRDYAQQEIFTIRRREDERLGLPLPETTLQRKAELLNGVLTLLQPVEREVVLRAFVLDQSDQDIAILAGLPMSVVRRTRYEARRMLARLHRLQ